MLKVLFDAINDKINSKCKINYAEIESLLKNIYNYYYGDGLYNPSVETKQEMANILDNLGEYNNLIHSNNLA